jgi:diguanylate cyclase (GGDEF)-like protein
VTAYVDQAARIADLEARLAASEIREAHLVQVIAEKDYQLEVRTHQATRDHLTGLLNRRGLEERWERDDVTHLDGLALLDVDGFKDVNDTYGHGAGDDVLRHAARDLTDRYRIAVRLSGDELLVIDTRDRLGRLVDEPLSWQVPLLGVPGSPILAVTASVGIARAVHSLRLTMARADAALYDAKQAQRGTARWFDRRRHPHLRRVEQLDPRPRVRLRDTRVRAA